MTDHQLLVIKAKLRLDRIKWDIVTPRFQADKMSPLYAIEVKNRLDAFTLEEQQPDELWNDIVTNITEIAQQHVPCVKPTKQNN